MDTTDELDRLAEAERQLKEQHAARNKELAALYKKNAALSGKRSGSPETASVPPNASSGRGGSF